MTKLLALLILFASLAHAGTVYRAQNFSGTLPKCADGDTFEACNLQQPVAHTAIGAGVKGLVFRKCNLMNCDVPKDAVVEQCFVAHFRTVTV